MAASFGVSLDDWQAYVLEQALGERADGKWSAFEVGLVVSRQNGKNVILVVREFAGLLLFGERMVVHTAHEVKTHLEHFTAMKEIVDNYDHIRKLVKTVRSANGQEAIIFKDGSRLRFVARSKHSGRGFSGDTIVFDEAYDLPSAVMDALVPTMAAKSVKGNPQLWYTSSAGMADSFHLRAVRDRALAGDDPRLCYLEWSAPADCDPHDPASWAQANPGYGVRISDEFIRDEQRILTVTGFGRERLGIWDDETTERVIPGHLWEQCVSDRAAATQGKSVFAIDVNPERTHAAIAAADATGNAEIIDHRAGTGWVVDEITRLVEKYGRMTPVGVDGNSPAANIGDELERAGVNVKRLGGKEMASACGAFYDAVIQGRVRMRRDPALEAAAAGARKRQAGDVWYWARRDATVDVSPLVAITAALRLAHEPRSAPRVVNLADLLDDDDWS